MSFKMIASCENTSTYVVMVGSHRHYYCDEHGPGQEVFPWVTSVERYEGKETRCEQTNFTVPIKEKTSRRSS